MKQTPKISVIIPSFNKVKFIQATLVSIFDQKYPNLEVVVQDGGSTDGTLEILRKYKKKYPKIIKLESKNDTGQAGAVNTGMNKATGDILTFINADDVYEKGSLQAVSDAYLTNSQALWFVGKGKVIDEGGVEIAKFITWYKNLLLWLNSYKMLLTVNYLIQPSVFITGKCWKKHKTFVGSGKFIMEYDMWLKIGKKEMPITIGKYLSSFRLTQKSFSRNNFDKTLSEDLNIVKKYTKNNIILFFHLFHNFLRKVTIKFF
jgi:glycosyltransferase involved in cell wall biosynthesis